MNADQINLTRNGVFATVIRNGKTGVSRASDRAAIIATMKLYGLTGNDAHFVGGWCMAQMGYGGGL